jgi:hypothetical protein
VPGACDPSGALDAVGRMWWERREELACLRRYNDLDLAEATASLSGLPRSSGIRELPAFHRDYPPGSSDGDSSFQTETTWPRLCIRAL